MKLVKSVGALIGVLTQRCVDRGCEGGEENESQADSSESCFEFYGDGADLVCWCDPCLMSAAINALTALREEREQLHAQVCTLADAAGERESIAALVVDRDEMTVYLKVEALKKEHENTELLTRRASEGDSPRQPAAPTDDDYPTIACPNCGDEATDLDGFGFMACTVCGYCTHPLRTGGVCGICGDAEPESADARILKPDGSQASGSATETDLRDLRTQLAHLTEVHERLMWQPIETAPKDGTTIILSGEGRVTVGGWISAADQGAEPEEEYLVSAGWWSLDLSDHLPTHWMPLPSPPDALLSPRDGTQLLEDQELTDDLTRRDTTGSPTDDPPQPPTGR